MMSENNFSGRLALSAGLPLQAVRAACWRHYRRHWWQGLLLGLVAVWLPFLPDLLHYARMGFPLKIVGSGGFAGGMMVWGFMLVCFVGVPSAVGGLLRLPWLRWLCRHARSRWHLVIYSAVGFQVNVALLVLWYWWNTSARNAPESLRELADIAGICQLASLPWLLSTASASWQLATDLRTLPRDEISPV